MAGRNEPDGESPIAPSARALGHNVSVYSVSELSLALKGMVERGFSRVRVRGEITGFKRHSSGHLYFRLKDESAVLEAVCWRGMASQLKLRPEDGIEVIATGRLSTYPGRSQYQIVVDALELAGEGALLKLMEERRKKLAAEGLFDAARKRPIPYLPEVIGVVTSPTGAVIRDILHRIAERFPRRVLVWPVPVQGEGAAEAIARAIAGFNGLPPGGPVPRPDVLIVARGGGSLEDLWAFNEEVVVRAASASAIPLISAVGHETDTTLIDFAADRRAPTPSAAAEMAVPVRSELAQEAAGRGARLIGAVYRLIERNRQEVRGLSRGLPDPASLLGVAAQRLDDRTARLAHGARLFLERRRSRLGALHLRHPRERLAERQGALLSAGRALLSAMRSRTRSEHDRLGHDATRIGHLDRRLARALAHALAERSRRLAANAKLIESYSYQRVLERGFVLVRDGAGRPVPRAAATRPSMAVALGFFDGSVAATVTGRVEKSGTAPMETEPEKKRGKKVPPAQGSLL